NYKHLNGSADEETVTTNGDIRTVDKETFETSTHFQDPELNDPRTQCFKRCTAYDKPKFESRCEAGFCECHGKDYQLNTCLPSVDGCIISKEINSRSTFIWGASTTAFHCSRHTGNTARDVHVIGIYGNHFSESTLVNIERSLDETKPLTIVLASHYPVRWKIKHKNLPISEIILLSDNKLSTSQAELLNTLEVSSATLPIIRTEYFPVGYGDDRYHSNSSEMFKNINKFIGPVKSFLGTNFADKIILKL
ncbi:uncharacterized protein LOC132748112, partial [Ruditapes philippinarum]|uniref:uncharacterized protein LOC132748112 n=1 Tax=Ruditapes philippinarum TaxID=129788 RepID=UPI00295BD706